jgi:hypothetical protein
MTAAEFAASMKHHGFGVSRARIIARRLLHTIPRRQTDRNSDFSSASTGGILLPSG